MNAPTAGGPEKAGPALRAALAWARSHRFGLEISLMLTLVLGAAGASGVASVARVRGLRSESQRLEQLRGRLRRWEAAPRAATPAEIADWSASQREVDALARPAREPLALARVVARRAAEVGIVGVHIRLEERDSAGPVLRIGSGPWSVETGATALRVAFRGGMSDVIGFLGALPPYVTVAELTVRPAEGGGPPGVQALLLARRVTAR